MHTINSRRVHRSIRCPHSQVPFLSVRPFLVLLSSFLLLFGGKGGIFTDAGGYLSSSLLASLSVRIRTRYRTLLLYVFWDTGRTEQLWAVSNKEFPCRNRPFYADGDGSANIFVTSDGPVPAVSTAPLVAWQWVRSEDFHWNLQNEFILRPT